MSTGAPNPKDMTFEEIVERLEGLTDQMASPEVGVEKVADMFEEAAVLHRVATERLDEVAQRIENLAEQFNTDEDDEDDT